MTKSTGIGRGKRGRAAGTYGQLKGLPEPINERLRLKLLVSEELVKRRGMGTTRDKVEKSLERK